MGRGGVACPKPAKGSGILAREKAKRERETHEDDIAKAVKARDKVCRWPEAHKCRGILEAAHIVNKSQNGPTCLENELAVCSWIHRRGPESIHGMQLKVETETPAGAEGPLSFWKQTGYFDVLGQPVYQCVGREILRGILERD